MPPTEGLFEFRPDFQLSRWKLTKREAEVLDLLSQGFGDAEIGVSLGMATGTAKSHIAKAASKLGVRGEKTAHRILLAKFWSCPLFRLGASRDDHPSKG